MRLAGLLLLVGVGSAAAEVELKNDSFVDGQPVVFQGGFAIGEIAASRFVAPEAGRILTKVQLLFGAATTTKTMTLRVYDDTGGGDAPGNMVFFGDYDLIGSDTAIQELLPDMPVELPAQFRIGLEFQHAGVPTIANDNDMTNAAGRNYLFALNGGWVKSSTRGVQGDWIIRAFIDGEGGPIGAACTGNGDCPTGEFCDTDIGACTFECRTGDDCNGNICTSLGQCLIDAGEGGGCCQSNREGEPVALFGLVGLWWVFKRRRRCAV